jgi:hypothetical protein
MSMAFYRRENIRILGSHDGASVHISSDTLASPAVQLHEAAHDLLFTQTADGMLHQFCCRAKGTVYDEQWGGTYSEVSCFLFEDTRSAHETAACYMGIHSLPTEVRTDEYVALSREYRAYYSMMAALIDKVSELSWMRYSFAWAFAHWCFSSPRRDAFFAEERPSIDIIKSIPSPSQRMIGAIAAMEARVEEWRDAALEGALGALDPRLEPLWRVTDTMLLAPGWPYGAEFAALKNELGNHAGAWLLDHLPFARDNWRERFKAGIGFKKLAEALGLNVKVGESDEVPEWFRLEQAARASAADTVTHVPTGQVEDLSALSPDAMLKAFEACAPATTDIFFLTEATAGDHTLLLFRQKLSSPDVADVYRDNGSYRVPAEWGLELAQRLLAVKAGGGFAQIRLWVMVEAEPGDLNEAIARCLSHALDLSEQKHGYRIPPEQLALYWRGSWMKVHDLPDVAVTWTGVALADTGNAGRAKLLSVRIARSPERFPGYILNAKALGAGGRIEAHEQLRISDGALKELALPEGPGSVSPVITPFLIAWHLWDHF